MNRGSLAVELHKNVPPNWYWESLRVDILQRFWHASRFEKVKQASEPSDIVLDIGCADGMFSKIILDATRARKLIGIDVIKNSIDWAEKHWRKNKRMKFQVGDAHTIKFPANYFDAVYILEVLEHVENPVKVLEGVRKVLKKGGYGIFLVPSDNNLFKIVWWLWLHFYPRGWVWRDTHIQTYRNDYLAKACKKAGFIVESNIKFNFGMLNLVKVRK